MEITQYHVLNGDSLNESFPKEIQGEIIVARECLIDGPVNGSSLEDLFSVRAKFISETYNDHIQEEYLENTAPEFYKIQELPQNAEVYLWFEDDLFCQVNLWFVIHLLSQKVKNHTIYLIRPANHDQYGFGGLDSAGLLKAYQDRITICDLESFERLWMHYKSGREDELLSLAIQLKNEYSFILPAVQAHLDRLPKNGNPGRPVQTLIDIMNELQTEEFRPVFREFCRRESIYGFGDLQVKRLFDDIVNNVR